MHYEDPKPGAPEWAVTFGDMMSLLLTFFIMLVALGAHQGEGKFQILADSLRQRFGRESDVSDERSDPHGNSAPNGERPGSPATGPMRTKPERQLPGGVLHFAAGQAELTTAHREQLAALAEELRIRTAAGGAVRRRIEIRGHTSRGPAAEKPLAGDLRAHYADNWHLAYTRCHRTLEFLVNSGLDPTQFRLGVAGEHEPANSAENPHRETLNERVEVLILNDLSETRGAARDAAPP
jgi:chemotaxis protein MotB